MAETVTSVGIRALLKALARLSIDAEGLLDEVGIDRESIDAPDGRVETAKVDALWVAAYRRSGDDRLAMRAAQQLEAGDYRTLDYLAAHSATLGEGVRRILGYFDLVDRRIHWTLDESVDPVSIRLQFQGIPDPLPRPPVEYTLGAFCRSLRLTTRLDWRPLAVEVGFSHPGVEAAAEHEAALGPMRYDAPATRLLVPGSWWRHPVAAADRGMSDLLEELAVRQVRDLPKADDLRSQLREAIRAELVGGTPTLESVAPRLAMSPRSLQRRLSELGTSFRGESDAVRKHVAELMLHDPKLALSEIAWLLGFSDPRAFTRAFRRWHDCAPSEWRSGRGPKRRPPR